MTTGLDYDRLAGGYDNRYRVHDYSGIERTIADFLQSGDRVLEVGCGTGRWLALSARLGAQPIGVDRSAGMLNVARATVPGSVVQGSALSLPFAAGTFDAVFAVNALHHFGDVSRFVMESVRVLRPGGRMLTVGLDPSLGRDRWFVYDFFPTTVVSDQRRYPPAAAIRAAMTEGGLLDTKSFVAQRWDEVVDAGSVLNDLDAARASCSQLALLSEVGFADGIARIREASSAAAGRGEALTLRGHLALYATEARRPL